MTNAMKYSTITLPDGARPRGLALSADGSRAAVCNYGLGSVSMIDTVNNVVIANIPAMPRPMYTAFDESRNRCYVTSLDGRVVLVIDTDLNAVIREIDIGVALRQITTDPINGRAYVTCPLVGQSAKAQIAVIDTNQDVLITTLAIEAGNLPTNIAIDPIGHRGFFPLVLSQNRTLIGRIDTQANQVIAPMEYPIDNLARDSTVWKNGLLYIAAATKTSVINTATEETHALKAGGKHIHLSPQGDRAYYLLSRSESGQEWSALQTVDTGTYDVVDVSLIAPIQPHSMAISANGKRVCITEDDRRSVVVADIAGA
ncbi:hypothetical protein BK654_07725 [Pseudomonas brassicacearum]|nr:hypothetical protein BK654_07725 [Pseudomonas brassicacearum]